MKPLNGAREVDADVEAEAVARAVASSSSSSASSPRHDVRVKVATTSDALARALRERGVEVAPLADLATERVVGVPVTRRWVSSELPDVKRARRDFAEPGVPYVFKRGEQDVVAVVAPVFRPQTEGAVPLTEASKHLHDAYAAMVRGATSLFSSLPNANADADADAPLEIIKLGDVHILRVAFGTLAMGVSYPAPRPPTDVFREALAACASFARQGTSSANILVDLADTYSSGPDDLHYVERVVASASLPNILLATKGGMTRRGSDSRGWAPAPRTGAEVLRAVRASRDALGLTTRNEPIPLWQFHHVDGAWSDSPQTFHDMLIAAKTACADGLISRVGLCNAPPHAVRMASDVLGALLVSVQNEYSVWTRDAEARTESSAKTSKRGVLHECARRGLVFIAYAPFGGLATRRGERSVLSALPSLGTTADPFQTYLAYLLIRLARVCPSSVVLFGSRDVSRVRSCLSAATQKQKLPPDLVRALDAEWPSPS